MSHISKRSYSENAERIWKRNARKIRSGQRRCLLAIGVQSKASKHSLQQDHKPFSFYQTYQVARRGKTMQYRVQPSHVLVTPFDPLCAWCIKAHGLMPNPQDSHTACDENSMLIRLGHKILQFERTASYVERFRKL
jgi:hypothetical protein